MFRSRRKWLVVLVLIGCVGIVSIALLANRTRPWQPSDSIDNIDYLLDFRVPDEPVFPDLLYSLGWRPQSYVTHLVDRFDDHILRNCPWLEDNKHELAFQASMVSPLYNYVGPSLGLLELEDCRQLLESIRKAVQFSDDNSEWEAISEAFGGSRMVLVPTGSFTMGLTSEQAVTVRELCQEYGGEQCEVESAMPSSRQMVEAPFWIDKYEVTIEQYKEYCEELGACGLIGVRLNCQNGDTPCTPLDYNDPDQPVTHVPYIGALRYCFDQGKRLPTAREWEYAARGPDNLLFPWGDTWDPNATVWQGNADGGPAPVTASTEDVSWVGAHFMSGNAHEIVGTVLSFGSGRRCVTTSNVEYPYDKDDGRELLVQPGCDVISTIKGGSWESDVSRLHNAFWATGYFSPSWTTGRDTISSTGFRCAMDV
jgi:formylglycine-generating enzyme required for sulfatase activity